jgi:hypothetical protein
MRSGSRLKVMGPILTGKNEALSSKTLDLERKFRAYGDLTWSTPSSGHQQNLKTLVILRYNRMHSRLSISLCPNISDHLQPCSAFVGYI